MNPAWRLVNEFQLSAEAEEPQAMHWVRHTLEELGVADQIVEHLLHHLMETGLATPRQAAPTGPSACYPVFVPAPADAARHGCQDWAYFLVTGALCRPDL